MHTIQLVVQSATLASVVVAIISLVLASRSFRRQMNAQVFMKYSERYEQILGGFPEDALQARFDSSELPPVSTPLRLAVLKYLNLCSEEFYLVSKNYLDSSLWAIWEAEIRRMLDSPLVRREWPLLRSEFSSHKKFLEYVDLLQDLKNEVKRQA